MLEPLQLELQEVVRGMWVLGTEPEFFVRAARTLTAQPSLQSLFFTFLDPPALASLLLVITGLCSRLSKTQSTFAKFSLTRRAWLQ